MDERTVPRSCAVRVDGLGLTSTDAFVLSQIDGTLTLEEVSEVTGLNLATVLEIAHRLAKLGAIEAPGARPKRPEGRYSAHEPKSEPNVPPVKTAPQNRRSMATIPAKPRPSRTEAKSVAPKRSLAPKAPKSLRSPARISKRPSGPPIPTSEDPRATIPAKRKTPPAPKPDDTCELDPALCATIDEALAGQSTRTHYQVLGINHLATAKEVQRAYFAIAATLHPDRHFGKKLGPYRQKLEHVFRRASDAYEVLRSVAKRAEYDGYLKLSHRSMQMERVLAQVAVEPPSSVKEAPPSSAKVPPPSIPKPVAKPVVVEAPLVEVPLVETMPEAIPPLRAETGRRAPVKSKAASILEAAQQALAAGDAVAAANHYRLALQYADDPGSRRYAESGLEEARRLLVDILIKKARYEEKEGRWSEAVVSYAKALDGRPDDPSLCERLANALKQEGQDLPRALKLGELAVQRAPRRAGYRATLGFIYADTGSRDKAIEQFERAVELDPEDETSKHALEALKKRRR